MCPNGRLGRHSFRFNPNMFVHHSCGVVCQFTLDTTLPHHIKDLQVINRNISPAPHRSNCWNVSRFPLGHWRQLEILSVSPRVKWELSWMLFWCHWRHNNVVLKMLCEFRFWICACVSTRSTRNKKLVTVEKSCVYVYYLIRMFIYLE